MGRGGIGARRARADRVAKSNRYALTGVQRGTRVAECYDAYRRWEFGARLGTITGRVGQRIIVVWDESPDEPEAFSDGDARYWVDTNRWRLTGPTQRTVFDAMAGDSKVSPPASRETLTRVGEDESMSISPHPGRQIEGEQEMADSTLSAKQVATRLGTDAKTFRRFLRSSSCTVDPVGQGGRYEFDKEDLPALEKQFTAWRKPGAKKEPKADMVRKLNTEKKSKPKPAPVEEIDDEEPSDEELAGIDDELEDLEFDDLEDLA